MVDSNCHADADARIRTETNLSPSPTVGHISNPQQILSSILTADHELIGTKNKRDQQFDLIIFLNNKFVNVND